jgi:hypothetical protein
VGPSRPTITASSISIGKPSIVIGRCSQKKIRLPKQKRLPHAIADAEVRKLRRLDSTALSPYARPTEQQETP